MRIQRNIPAYEIDSGVTEGNVRELIKEEMSRKGYSCKCIRCREVGLKSRMENLGDLRSIYDNVSLLREEYDASQGREIFLSYEDKSKDVLIGFLRLRKPSELSHRSEISGNNTCLVRELHVYGNVTPLGINDSKTWQHRGFGESLMAEAERIAGEELHAKKMVVISALGTKEYYKTLGYKPQGPYMVKAIN
jgi:elongator complex protein 3